MDSQLEYPLGLLGREMRVRGRGWAEAKLEPECIDCGELWPVLGALLLLEEKEPLRPCAGSLGPAGAMPVAARTRLSVAS